MPRLGQRFEIEPGEQAVLPQRGHRVGFGFTGAHGDHQPRPPRLRKLMHDVGRQPVEQVRVVDADQNAALTLLCDKGIDEPADIGIDADSDSVIDPVNAPSGSGRADSVPVIQFVRSPAACARAQHFSGEPVLPTPAAPQITTPE